MTAVIPLLSGRLRAPAAALVCAAALAACARSAEEGSGAAPPPGAASPAGGLPETGLPEMGPGQPPPAEAGLLLLGRGDLKGAEPLLVSARRQAPDDARVLEGLGALYARTDRLRQAEESYRAALAKTPGSIRARLGLAAVFVDSGRYEEARAALAEILKAAPDDPTASLKLALLMARSGAAVEAEAGARRALARQPDNPEGHYVLGLALGESGRYEEAVREMRRTEELQPAHLGALSHLVTFSVRLGRGDEAERWRRAWQEALLRQRVEERVRDHRLKGVEAFNRGDFAASLAEFDIIAREDPDDPEVHLHLGSTRIALHDLEAARAEILTSLRLEPRSERALVELGRVEALQNRLDEAIAALQKAIAVNPEFPEPHYYLAGIYRARGDASRSAEEMARFEALRRRSPGAAMEVQPGGRP